MSLTKVTHSMIAKAQVYVTDFGAVADWNGTSGTDNTAAINAAYAKAKQLGGAIIVIPTGSYYCSSLVGSNPNSDADWGDNIEFVGEQGTNLIFSGTYAGGTCLGLQGDHIAIRNISVNSTRTLDYRSPLTPQRTPYQLGIYVGGKQNLVDLNRYATDVQVSGCIVQNMNLPIVLQASSNIRCENNTIDQFTDTGIIVNDCTTDIWVLNNKVTRGGDDCFFARVNPGSPYSVAGSFSGRIFVQGNMFHDTFGKNAGFGGYGAIDFSNNYCSLNWAGGVNLENTWGDQNNPKSYQDVLIANNMFYRAGQNWDAGIPDPARHVPPGGASPSAIHTVYANDPLLTYIYRNISIIGNKIIEPYYSAIALSAINGVYISGNTFTAGLVNHGAGAIGPISSGIEFTALQNATATVNTFDRSSGVYFNNCYSVATSTGPLAYIRIYENADYFNTTAIAFSDASAVSATNFNSYDLPSGGLVFNLKSYTYANLPLGNQTAYTSSLAYCSNGRKVGEGVGVGTGVPVYYANGSWRVFSTDAAVAI
jgi:hypothetical protein